MNRTGPKAILPIKGGGAGGRFFSERRNGVAGKGRGGNDSPPVRCCGGAGGGGPQSTGPLPSWAKPAEGKNSIPAVPEAAQQCRAASRRNRRREGLSWCPC